MLPIHSIIWHEWRAKRRLERVPEPSEAMENEEQVRAYVKAYEWGGPTSALQLHHLRELSRMIRPGDTVVDLACGPGPLLLELAPHYPDVEFIGVDLSPTMLAFLRNQAKAQGLSNIRTLEEDIRTLPSFASKAVDLVISTSALHHLPKESDLDMVFARMNSLLKEEGGFYLFDFGQLSSPEARRLCVAEVGKLAPAITTEDYRVSLDAAFPIDQVFEKAQRHLPRPFEKQTSSFVNFFYMLQSPARADRAANMAKYIEQRWSSLTMSMKLEHTMLRLLRKRSTEH